MSNLRTDRQGLLNTLQQHGASYRTVNKARRLAIERALVAGIPIADVAKAAGLTHVRIWQISREIQRRRGGENAQQS